MKIFATLNLIYVFFFWGCRPKYIDPRLAVPSYKNATGKIILVNSIDSLASESKVGCRIYQNNIDNLVGETLEDGTFTITGTFIGKDKIIFIKSGYDTTTLSIRRDFVGRINEFNGPTKLVKKGNFVFTNARTFSRYDTTTTFAANNINDPAVATITKYSYLEITYPKAQNFGSPKCMITLLSDEPNLTRYNFKSSVITQIDSTGKRSYSSYHSVNRNHYYLDDGLLVDPIINYNKLKIDMTWYVNTWKKVYTLSYPINSYLLQEYLGSMIRFQYSILYENKIQPSYRFFQFDGPEFPYGLDMTKGIKAEIKL